MSEQERKRRIAAVKTADAINAIEGAPISEYARELSRLWVAGELDDEEMLARLFRSHEKLAAQVQAHA